MNAVFTSMRSGIYILQLVWFAASWVLYSIHATFTFFIRQGAPLVISVTVGVLALLFRTPLMTATRHVLAPIEGVIGYHFTALPFVTELIIMVTLFVASILYSLASRLLRPFMAALPAPTRPLLPQRRLKAKPHIIPVTTATCAVPKRRFPALPENQSVIDLCRQTESASGSNE